MFQYFGIFVLFDFICLKSCDKTTANLHCTYLFFPLLIFPGLGLIIQCSTFFSHDHGRVYRRPGTDPYDAILAARS